MDLKDFEGLFIFKLILPLMYIISWLSMFLGPAFFPVVYQKLCFAVLVYTGIKLLMFGATSFVVLV
jgi:hypothetical protein